MKILALTLSVFLVFTSIVIAKDEIPNGQGYQFIHDFTDCLYKLELAASYSIKDIPQQALLKKLQGESVCLKEAKGFMEKWLDNPDKQIKKAAWYVYGIITVIDRDNSKLIEALVDPLEKGIKVEDIAKNISQQKEYWSMLYESTGYVVWAVIKPDENKDTKQEIPFIISEKERLRAIAYLNKVFKDYFQEYKKLADQKKKVLIDNFNLEIPVWSALYLRALLSAQTYADIDKIDYLKLNP